MSEKVDLRENIKRDGYSPVAIDLAGDDLSYAMERYASFLRLGEKYQDATRFLLTGRGDGDFGQYRRVAGSNSERGIVPDNKELFHFGAQSRQVIESRLRGDIPRDMRDFMDITEHIFWAAQASKNHALTQLDHWNMGLVDVMSPEFAPLNDVLRLLAYYRNGGRLAKKHFDRGVSTLAIGESRPGLRIAPGQNGIVVDSDEVYMEQLESLLQPVEHKISEAKFFLGAGWNRLPPHYRLGNEDMPLGFHDVQEEEEAVDDEIIRCALVMFSNPHIGFEDYTVPTPPETRPYKQLGRLSVASLAAA